MNEFWIGQIEKLDKELDELTLEMVAVTKERDKLRAEHDRIEMAKLALPPEICWACNKDRRR